MKNWSLTKKMLTFISAMFIGYSLILGFVIGGVTKNIIKPEIDKQILNSLNSITANIDGDKLQELIVNGKDSNGYFEELNDYLIKVKEKSSFDFIYTIGKFNDNKYKYIVDGVTPGHEDFEEYGTVVEEGEDSNNPYEHEDEAIKNGSTISDMETYDRWGTIITGNVAIYNSKNQPVAILSADINVDDYSSSLKKIIGYIILSLVVGGAIIIGCITTYLSKALKPLKNIKDVALKIADGELNQSIEVNSDDEIGKISSAMNEMVNNLKSMIKNIDENSKSVLSYSDNLTI
ncbi:MAG: HAMP domain-containing protein, partial [Clostridium sp.]